MKACIFLSVVILFAGCAKSGNDAGGSAAQPSGPAPNTSEWNNLSPEQKRNMVAPKIPNSQPANR
jgi:hypothetical protein